MWRTHKGPAGRVISQAGYYFHHGGHQRRRQNKHGAVCGSLTTTLGTATSEFRSIAPCPASRQIPWMPDSRPSAAAVWALASRFPCLTISSKRGLLAEGEAAVLFLVSVEHHAGRLCMYMYHVLVRSIGTPTTR